VELCPDSVPVIGDATKSVDIERASRVARELLGPVELLVAAAGMAGPSKIAIDVDEKEFGEVFALNVKGPWLAAKYSPRALRAPSSGSSARRRLSPSWRGR
jgi:2-keto-3-deoxy-L-fuconate dehydrogenase